MEAPTWQDWQFRQDCIISPSGVRWTPAQLEAWFFERQLLAELKNRESRPAQYLMEF